METISDYKIAIKGQLWVNLPVAAIILGCWYILANVTSMDAGLCILIATGIGWTYWEIVVDKWLAWALSKGVDQKRLTKIGVRNLLIWGSFRVENVAKKMNP